MPLLLLLMFNIIISASNAIISITTLESYYLHIIRSRYTSYITFIKGVIVNNIRYFITISIDITITINLICSFLSFMYFFSSLFPFLNLKSLSSLFLDYLKRYGIILLLLLLLN